MYLTLSESCVIILQTEWFLVYLHRNPLSLCLNIIYTTVHPYVATCASGWRFNIPSLTCQQAGQTFPQHGVYEMNNEQGEQGNYCKSIKLEWEDCNYTCAISQYSAVKRDQCLGQSPLSVVFSLKWKTIYRLWTLSTLISSFYAVIMLVWTWPHIASINILQIQYYYNTTKCWYTGSFLWLPWKKHLHNCGYLVTIFPSLGVVAF